MKVIANYSVQLLGTELTLTAEKTYRAVRATNQPDYKEKDVFFVTADQGYDAILCTMGDEIRRA
jgi:hypothetical protein